MHGHITTVLDAVGLLLIVIGVGLAVGVYSPAGGFAASGVALLLGSWLADRAKGTT